MHLPSRNPYCETRSRYSNIVRNVNVYANNKKKNLNLNNYSNDNHEKLE